MSGMQKDPKARHIPVQYDCRGNPYWKSTMSPPGATYGLCHMVPDRVIPVIFVPGVMGSNLIGTGQAKGYQWLVDSSSTMAAWMFRGPDKRKMILTPATTEVSDSGKLPSSTQLPEEELKRRGWGEVAAMSYQDFLVWLEHNLNDFDNYKDGERMKLLDLDLHALKGENRPGQAEINLTYRYRFPVHACGYNWLASNADSGLRLSRRIQEIIDRYKAERKKVEKVIILTHSMGGLVARHCSEVLGRNKDILGIVHGVMPAIGAAAVYRRFKSGTEGPHLAAKVLGEDAAEMTAVLSSAPGPCQLLPTPEYGNGWLRIQEGKQEFRFPQHGDPYGEIYTVRDKWWSMCDDELINPLNEEKNARRRQAQVDRDWGTYRTLIKEDVKPFHDSISGKYHPNTHAFFGSSDDHKAYGTVTWSGSSSKPGHWTAHLLPDWLVKDDRPADIREGRNIDPYHRKLDTTRQVAVPLRDKDRSTGLSKGLQFTISEPEEVGDGTVPYRSGNAPRPHCRSFLRAGVEHEPAFKPHEGLENLRACRFTLRAIVRIAQDIQQTSLRYDI